MVRTMPQPLFSSFQSGSSSFYHSFILRAYRSFDSSASISSLRPRSVVASGRTARIALKGSSNTPATAQRSSQPPLPSKSFLPALHRRSYSAATLSTHGTMASHSLYTPETPEEVRNATGLHLITMSTPNGQKVQIFLEELAEVYGTKWGVTKIDIGTDEQKRDWFLRLNPNGRIPILIDNNQSPPFPVMETSAELLYLQAHYDPENLFGFTNTHEQSQMMQWLFFWHGSGAPYQGQTNHFTKYADVKIPYAITRYRNETLRVYHVLELHLSGHYTGGLARHYLAGSGVGRYSLADVGTWPWVRAWKTSGFTDEEMAPLRHLRAWIERLAEREAVQRGVGERYSL